MNNCKKNQPKSGFSLVEMTVMIAVLGIISGIAVSSVGNIIEESRLTVSENILETLNKATREYSHSNSDLIYESFPTSEADELIVLRALQFKAPGDSQGKYELNPKGPFMRPDWQPATTTDPEKYRATWTGSSWRLFKPGDVGGGLKIVFDGSDLGFPVIFPPSYELPTSR